MATRTAKLRVELDGEKKYKEAIAEINRESKTLGAEMKKLAAEYKGNENSIEALTKKQTLLDRALLESKAKVEDTRKQLDSWRAALERVRQEQGASSEEYKQAQKKVQEYEYALANAEAAQYDLEHQLEETNQELNRQGDELDDENGKMVSLGDAVDQVAGKLGIKLPDGAKKALDGMKSMSAGSVAAIGAIATAVAAAIKAVKELNEMTLEAASKADDLLTKSLQTGVSTDMLQQWEYASQLIDVSVETMTGIMSKLTKSMYDAQSGSDTAAAAFEVLGVNITNADGSLRSANEVMFDALASLAEVGNATERDAMAMEVFGKSAQELNPLILNLDEAQRLYNEALQEGYVLSESQLQLLGEVDDAHQKYTQTLEKNRDMIALQWAPTTKQAYEQLTELTNKAGQALINSGLIENFGHLVSAIMNLLDAGTDLFGSMPSWLNPLKNLSAQLQGVAAVAATVADALNLISGLAPWNWGSGKATTALGWNIGSGQMSNLQKLKYSSSDYVTYNAAGTDNWRGGLTWVGEAGPELVALPRGSQIYSAQESRNMGGGNTYNITVANIDELSELLQWFDGLQIRGRMK